MPGPARLLVDTTTAAAPGDDGRACGAGVGQDPEELDEVEAFDVLDDPDEPEDPADPADVEEPELPDDPELLDDPLSPDDPDVLVDAGFEEPDDDPEPDDFFELLSVR